MRPEGGTPTGAVVRSGFPAVRTSRHAAPVSTPALLHAEPEVRGITTPVAIRPPKALGRRSTNEGQDARRLEVQGRRPRSSLLVPFRFSPPTVGHVDDTVFRSRGVQDATSFPAGGTLRSEHASTSEKTCLPTRPSRVPRTRRSAIVHTSRAWRWSLRHEPLVSHLPAGGPSTGRDGPAVCDADRSLTQEREPLSDRDHLRPTEFRVASVVVRFKSHSPMPGGGPLCPYVALPTCAPPTPIAAARLAPRLRQGRSPRCFK